MVKLRGILPFFPLAWLAALFCLPLTSCTRVAAKTNTTATEAIPVRAVRAVREDVPLEIEAVGNVEAIDSVDVKSRIAGQINRVAFAEGQSVSKGQLLFSIDRETLERQMGEEQANLERDAAMEQQARAVVARDAAAEKQSQSEADVARQLGTLGVISRQRVSQLITTSDTSQAALHADQSAVEAAAGSTKADRARLAETQLQLRFTDVVAPISGRAGAVMVKAGNMVRDNDTTLVTLRQLAPIYITFGIPEQSLAEVRRLNAAGQLTVDASTDSTNVSGSESADGLVRGGHLVFIDNTVDATTGTIRLKAIFPNTNNALWPGEFVNVRLQLGMETGRTVVPESSVQDSLDGKYVWLIQSGSASTASVTVLRTYRPSSGPEQAIIGSGIKSGDMVVTEGQLRLTDGVTVTLLSTPGTKLSHSNPTLTP
ncbi:efflux RND transporter periplasmic adaptor subunit [Edaphobacter dinghuensis]|uniref:RND efflux membrane fusion protein n=1 Tax=Edaphobacter dinghuensis TaxID=1560005 RepID=A0A917H1L8_9BACT|nr:efflux RND transporter periplasmic adaptor subunit [Edaphobacter dinghuensis]GGG64595.1 RND efflux membrane fusion protein [Edaphobacter dinghuensis]